MEDNMVKIARKDTIKINKYILFILVHFKMNIKMK